MRVANRKARDFEILERFEAGMVLKGAEVKSIKAGMMSLTGARVILGEIEGERGVWLVGASVNRYPQSAVELDQLRTRKLLLSRKEEEHLASKVVTKGLTIVPLACYTKGNLIKVEIALVRGKKQFEKREEEKRRAIEKKLRQLTKSRR